MKKMKKGFTLVEIMIVVAIIGLLAAIAIPSFVKSRNSARQNACINNLRMIDSAKEQYAMANNSASDATLTSANVAEYVKTLPICPAGGTTFADSYTIGSLTNSPVCLKVPATHAL